MCLGHLLTWFHSPCFSHRADLAFPMLLAMRPLSFIVPAMNNEWPLPCQLPSSSVCPVIAVPSDESALFVSSLHTHCFRGTLRRASLHRDGSPHTCRATSIASPNRSSLASLFCHVALIATLKVALQNNEELKDQDPGDLFCDGFECARQRHNDKCSRVPIAQSSDIFHV